MLNKSLMHTYQDRGVNHILDKRKVALFLDMGLGKTITTLTAIEDLMHDSFDVGKTLIIAPLRVCNSVWAQEAEKWAHTQGLKFVNLSGGKTNMLKGLQRKGDVYLINRENTKALVENYTVKSWPFGMVVIDESSSFKSHSSQRFKALRKVAHKSSHFVLLTGTPAPNGYGDLWSQIYLLDGGERLGRTIGIFRQRYMEKDYFGFNYTIKDGAMAKIQNAIQDVVLSMKSEDYLELPEFIPTVLNNKLEGPLLKQYKKLEKEMTLAVNGQERVTAMTAATLTNKLMQFSSGNMYDEDRKVHHVHDLKIDTLQEIIDENPNDNVLVAYNFKHELTTLREAFPDGVSLDKEGKEVERWNKGEIKLLFAHPASAGHGLNLQDGGSLVVWYGLTWSLELYQQFNKRLHRQGQQNHVRCMHIAVGEIEHKVMSALASKDVTQEALLAALK